MVVDGPIRSAKSWLFPVGDRLVVAGVFLLGVIVAAVVLRTFAAPESTVAITPFATAAQEGI